MEEFEKESTETENQAPTTEENVIFDESEALEAAEKEEKQEGFINQEAVNKRINEISFEKHEERRKREKLEAELAELKGKWEQLEAKKNDVVIPDMPDVYDDDFEKKMREREDAIRKSALIQAEKKMAKDREEREMTERLKARQKKVLDYVDRMKKKATEYGITAEELDRDDQTVSSYIQNPELAGFLISHDEAPLLIKYLSGSATELDKISRMQPLEASVYITNKIAPEAMKLKPGVTKTPEPARVPKGRSSPKKDPYLKGVSFE